MSNKPQWSTPQRQKHLVELFQQYGNLCLQGHPVCQEITHYVTHDVKMEWVSDGKVVEGLSKSGERTGIYRTEWKKRQVPVACGPVSQPRYVQRFPSDDGSRTNSYVRVWTGQRVNVEGDYLARLYNKVAEGAIESWKTEDRERRSYEWELEQRQIIDGTYGKYGSKFDPVARDTYVNSRPEYYLVGLGVNPFTKQRVALVRIPSTMVHLFVDVGGAVQEVSKNARRKARRYGKDGLIKATIDQRCRAAVADWWGTHR